MKNIRLNRYLPYVIFAVVAAIGLGMTLVVKNAEDMAVASRFEVVADDAADRVRERVSQHIAFLQAAHSMFAAHQEQVTRQAFSVFVSGLDLEGRFSGLQGIGFARRIPTGEEGAIADELQRGYGIDRAVWPETAEQMRAPIVMLEPNDIRNAAALGFDMFAEPTRRTAMIGALATNGPFASAPVELVQEITSNKQAGFLVYIPVREPGVDEKLGPISGFVYAPFRAGDLHRAALSRSPKLPVVVESKDVTDGEESVIYRSSDFETAADVNGLEVDRTFNIAGRDWKITIRATPEFRSSAGVGTFALATISLFLAVAIAVSTRSQLMAVAAAHKLQATTEKNLKDKEMMLQEMKHRIKNSIARVLAIARHTAAHADSLDDFSNTFMARLQSMGTAQDMLTRSHWQRADLEELLTRELEQVFGVEADYSVSGPAVELNERATQSLGLVFHELATNALKYGGISEEGGGLRVNWSTRADIKSGHLDITWCETSPVPIDEPDGVGFGTRLIDANINSELGGTIVKNFASSGLSVSICIPRAGYS